MIVMKFGGSSIKDSKMIRQTCNIIKSNIKRRPVVVVSAMKGVTDMLIDLATSELEETGKKLETIINKHCQAIKDLNLDKRIIAKELIELRKSAKKSEGGRDQKSLDSIMSFGERFSTRIVTAYLNKLGVDARAYDAYDIGMLTDSNFSEADILPATYKQINEKIKAVAATPVITGFIGKDEKGNVTTLGRGGSDYTACIIGAAIGASEIQIWTDVDGIMTADPKIVKDAKSIRNLSYAEETELEILGATKLHPKGILPAVEKSIKIRVLNTLNPGHPGTLITNKIREGRRVASITHKDSMYEIRISTKDPKKSPNGSIGILERNGLYPEIISKPGQKMAVIVDGHKVERLSKAVKELSKIANVEVTNSLARISIVGKSVSSIPNISKKMLSSLGYISVKNLLYHRSEVSQSVVVSEKDAYEAVNTLHKTFFGA